MIKPLALMGATVLGTAAPALAQLLPSDLLGSWDVSAESCAAPGTSVSQVDISSDRIETFGGIAVLREVERIGAVTYAAGDFQQLEGAAEVERPTREHFRMTQTAGKDRMTFVWKDVQTVDLVRCGAETAATEGSAAATPEPAAPSFDGQLPIPLGLWVVAGESCQGPANAGWRVYDGAGLRGASSVRCEIDATERSGDGILFSQLCEASDDGTVRPTRDLITIIAPRRFTLVESSEGEGQDFNWCGPQLSP